MEVTPFVSVVIAHDKHRGEESLKKCLDSIRAQVNAEVFVATDGNVSEARNKALLQSTGEIVFFFDDDVELRSNCIQELLQPFENNDVAVVGGVNIPFPNIDFKEQISSSFYSSPFLMGRSAARYTPRGNVRITNEAEILTCNMAIKRDVLMKTGGFPTDIVPCEENVLVNRIQKLGYTAVYTPFAIVYHSRPKIFWKYWKTIFRYGMGRGMMMRKHEGNPQMMWKPNRRWLYYLVGAAGHYISYVSGILYGWVKT